VIFVTAYDEHALRAFEVHALDYILKPYTDERFMLALQRAKDQIHQKKVHQFSQRLIEMLDYRRQQLEEIEPSPIGPESLYLHRLVVKSNGRIFFIKTPEIDWIEAADYYVQLHIGAESYLLRETLSNLVRRLDPNQFQRIHRSTVVNLDRVISMEPYFHGNHIVFLKDGTQLTMSRRHRHRLESVLGRTLV
jgi:two-component system LytT family response regulator